MAERSEMIAEIISREFVLESLREIRQKLERKPAPSRRRRGLGAPAVPEERAEVLEELSAAETRESSSSSGQEKHERPAARRRHGAAPAIATDEAAFISRDWMIGILQSTLEEFYETQKPNWIQEGPTGVRGRRASRKPPPVTKRTLRDPRGRRLGEKFSTTDIGWIQSKIAEGIRLFKGKHDFNEQPAAPHRISNTARLVLLGDWGSGLERAQAVASEARKIVDQGLRERREQHVIHLGDVYYSGWKNEYKKRFIPYWPVRANEGGRIGSWAVNANHDMYSGGDGYFDFLLSDPRFAKQQRSSFFSLFNDNWKILGLDTAYEDHALRDPQAQWVFHELSSRSQKGLLLSHHQLFSAYEKVKDKLEKKLTQSLQAGLVRSWFWGHEHRCMLFKPFKGVQFARCVGHSGIPRIQSRQGNDPYPPPGDYELRDVQEENGERWGLFGFAVMDLDGSTIRVRYIDEEGHEHKAEQFS